MTTTYDLAITGSNARYMPDYARNHETLESARAEFARVIEQIPADARAAHSGMIYGSDGSEQSA